jgi:uncharacterized integral membrane protein
MTPSAPSSEIYEGQFGPFTITPQDRREVVIYRSGLVVAACCWTVGICLVLGFGDSATVLRSLSWLYGLFWLALGVSLWAIHIYMRFLHRTLQGFWAIGGLASLALALGRSEPLALTIYQHPLTILGVGFTFAALTGIFFKEAFCFNRFETKLLTPLVPCLLLGHLAGILPTPLAQGLLIAWAGLFSIFAWRKSWQAIPPDIGDKSVFDYLNQQRHQSGQASQS